MKVLTREEQYKRLENLKYAEEKVKSCVKRERIHNYMPGQVTYHLGDSPAKFSSRPTEYDYNLVKKLAENGVEIIQTHSDWVDTLRLYGGDKFSSSDPEGIKAFIDLCHEFNIKVLAYMSTGFFDERDPDFKPCFDRLGQTLYTGAQKLRLCSLESPEWCSYMVEKTKRILETHEFDGLYNDMGHDLCSIKGHLQAQADGVEPEPIPYEPCAEDMLARLYSLVKENNGIMKHHYLMNQRPVVKDKIYDYLWVGEAIVDVAKLKATVQYDPYVVPCPDLTYSEPWENEKYFALFLPLMQFPLRIDGRPVTAAGYDIPGIEYTPMKPGKRKKYEYVKAHPNGPYIYGQWSGCPDDENYRELWFYYLKLYRQITQENTVCHIDIKENTIVKEAVPENVCMSLYTGDEQYLCIGNTSTQSCQLHFYDEWTDLETGLPVPVLDIHPNKVRFLKREVDMAGINGQAAGQEKSVEISIE